MKKQWNPQFRPRIILLILTIICLLSIGVSYFRSGYGSVVRTAVGVVIVPLQTGINEVGGFFSNLTKERVSLQDALAENEQLKEENSSLRDQMSRYQANLSELERLQGLLGMQESYDQYDMIGAVIVAKSAVNTSYQFTINKGSADGIEVDQTVISGDGLVGIILNVALHSATVQTLLDNTSRVSGMLAETLDTCIVSGNRSSASEGYVDLSYIDQDAAIEDGSQIVTSNVSSKYLEGIVIGTAADIQKDTNNLTKSGHLIPAVDFEHLREVLVIQTTKTSLLKQDPEN